MALPVFSLGDYTFLTFGRLDNPDSPPGLCGETTRLIEREGVTGSGLIRCGRRGKPIQYRSTSDYSTMAKALAAQSGYDEMIGEKKFTLVWADQDFAQINKAQYLVLDVETVAIKRLSAMAGGLTGAQSGYLVEAVWTLVAVPAE